MDLEERLKNSIEIDPESGCWVWKKSRFGNGYGQIGSHSKKTGTWNRKAHRVSWEVFKGPIPDGFSVLHKCDNKPCINPDHLFLGTQLENVLDCMSKGRRAKPEIAGGGRKLNKEQVLEIIRRYEKGETQQKLADEFGVSRPKISLVVRGLRYRYWTNGERRLGVGP